MQKKILFVLCLLTGLLFINGGLDKFLHYMPMPKDMPAKMINAGMAMSQIEWLMPLVGAVEIVGGLLLIFPRTRALGVIVLMPVLAGILLTNAYYAPSGLPIVAAIFAVIAWAIIDNRHKYLQLISK